MSYEPTNWKTGDVVTAAKLNKMEDGIAEGGGGSGGGVFIVTRTDTVVEGKNTSTLDKTWQEIYNAMLNGSKFVMQYNENGGNTTTEQLDGLAIKGGSSYWVYIADLEFYSNPPSPDGTLYEKTNQ